MLTVHSGIVKGAKVSPAQHKNGQGILAYFCCTQTSPQEGAGVGVGHNSLVSGSLQNTLGQFWLSPILGGKIFSFLIFLFFVFLFF